MTATQLKYLAAVFMVIDHVGMLFEPLSGLFPRDSLWYYAFRYVGRLAFPIFAYFVAEGCRRTHDYTAYLKRLFLFALLTQIPLYIAMPEDGRSVITTFFLASLAIGVYRVTGRPDGPCPASWRPGSASSWPSPSTGTTAGSALSPWWPSIWPVRSGGVSWPSWPCASSSTTWQAACGPTGALPLWPC